MKKLKLVGILVAVVLIGSVISIPLINNHTAYKVEKTLCEIPLPEGTELIESLSQAGKLTGNGNGMQYLMRKTKRIIGRDLDALIMHRLSLELLCRRLSTSKKMKMGQSH